ncbi:MAG: 3-hydroxyacyl-CoA dehydrogenase [Acidimicrobiales bacterium]|nr:3-hydroxyacyl-CoA dehydrogenase [Hyphomonadaceae bacterium]RZV43186.1 MAG: 3-hydroxyacyl-CoA dehydrogenase [Acidimicrobiales bacterium]
MTVPNDAMVTVAGAGLMGTGIAHAFAVAGFKTCLFDINAEQIEKAKTSIKKTLDGGVRLGKLEQSAADAALKKLSFKTKIADAAQDADLFIETVSENLAIKHAVLKDADTYIKKDGLIGTNTSALSVTEIATACENPSRVIGMHFFNPVHKMKLVEIVLGIATSEATLATTRAFCDQIGKTSIVVNESPGLTTSRMSAMMGNEAMWMLQEGTASAEDIDTALRMGFNHPMGPLELGDMTGWDTRLAVLKYLHSTLGEKFRPCPLIIKMVAAGRHGRKTGHGVYEYKDGQKVPGSGLKASMI